MRKIEGVPKGMLSFFFEQNNNPYRYTVKIGETVDNRDYFDLCISQVIQVSGLSGKDILNGRTEECTDARYILVYFLALRLTDNEIAKVCGMSRQRVNYLKNHFQWVRGKWSVRCKVREIEIEIESQLSGQETVTGCNGLE